MPPASRSRRRALGQNFLVDESVAERAVALAELAPGARVAEIGPGRGALTDILLAAGHPVWAVEIDDDLAEALRARREPGLELVHADFLRVPIVELPEGPVAVVANLPYSRAGDILERLVVERTRFPRLVLMLQREVAERVCASPGGRVYGSLSVLTALYAETTFGFVVPPEAFRPRPEVESAVIRLDLQEQPRVSVDDVALFRRVVKAAFAQRRKTLRNALGAGFGADRAARALADAGIDSGRRAETVSLLEYSRLAATFGQIEPEGATTSADVDA